MKRILNSLAAGLAAIMLAGSAHAAGGAEHPHGPEEGFPHEGVFGRFEMDSVQRGYQVYREVCSSCHGMKLLHYRNLGEPGGPFYDPNYPNANDNPLVKEFAAQDTITDATPDEFGDPVQRPARPSDQFKSPYANEQQARAANGGALPPDFSVITKARHGGANYIYSLITGYPSWDVMGDGEIEFGEEYSVHEGDEHGLHGTLIQPQGQYYNPYMAGDTTPQWEGDPRHAPPGGFLAMPPQLSDGQVEYLDGTEATVEQMAYDVAQFLAWAGEPKQTNRKKAGVAVLIYLALLAGVLWLSYKRIWRNVAH
ncbi:MAG: cytochrome c1 [Hyphomonadaceae bacterium]|nr:cytochrome c1 [Hyphomonadaceae bacterium]